MARFSLAGLCVATSSDLQTAESYHSASLSRQWPHGSGGWTNSSARCRSRADRLHRAGHLRTHAEAAGQAVTPQASQETRTRTLGGRLYVHRRRERPDTGVLARALGKRWTIVMTPATRAERHMMRERGPAPLRLKHESGAKPNATRPVPPYSVAP